MVLHGTGLGGAGKVTVGFARRADGEGLAYAALSQSAGRRPETLRVPFRTRVLPALQGREVAYAALTAVARELLRRGLPAVDVRIDDETLPLDLAQRRALPAALTLPYVVLRCTLNRFRPATLEAALDGAARDLSARARAELHLGLAA